MSVISEAQRIQQAKADIKAAIEAKGITVPSNALFGDYAALIASIPSIPAPPSADGTYTLSVTVTSGEPVYGTWTSAT